VLESIMKARAIWAVGIVLCFACVSAWPASAQDEQPQQGQQEPQKPPRRGPSTSEERARAVKVAHELEDDPLGKDAKADREWAIQWIIDIPDITVDGCLEFFGKLPDPPNAFAKDVMQQMIISRAAFMIEHPDKAKDDQAVATAGMLGSLKAYQSILKQNPDARWPYIDKLVQMRDEGKLDDHITDSRRRCALDEEDEPDADTMRAQVQTH
jgi:hypothetical protein